MKNLLFIFAILPTLSFANYSKPELVARFSDVNAHNVPGNVWCFTGEPAIHKETVYMNCLDNSGFIMARWGKFGYKEVARTSSDRRFSTPVTTFNKMTWHEFDETRILRGYEASTLVRKFDIRELGPLGHEPSDSFLEVESGMYSFKTKGVKPQFFLWKNNKVSYYFIPGASYIYSPYIGPAGELSVKMRYDHLKEDAPDKLFIAYNGIWKKVLEDKDSNPKSRWKSFRNQVAVEGNTVVVVANDGNADYLLEIENGREKVLARTGGADVAKFDFFAPKMKAGVIVVRGEDSKGLKMVYVKDNKGFRKLVGQGDLVESDLGPAKIDYQDKDAVFYGAPGIDEKGNIYLQATLSTPEKKKKLLGIGLLKFKRE